MRATRAIASAARGFEARGHTGLLRVFTDRARHHQTDRERRVHRFFARRSLDEVGSSHHGDEAGARDVPQREQITGAENHFHVRRAASVFEGCDFVVEGLPPSSEDVRAGDHDVDLLRAGLHRAANFRDAFRQGREARRKAGGDGRDADATALESAQSRFDERMVDAHGGGLQIEFFDPETLHELLLEGLARFRAQPAHALVRVVAGERGQIHTGNRAQQPGNLPVFLHCAAGDECLRAALDRAGVDADGVDPIEVQQDAAVRLQRPPGELRDGCVRGGGERLGSPGVQPFRDAVPFDVFEIQVEGPPKAACVRSGGPVSE